MRALLLTGIIFFACSSFLSDSYYGYQKPNSEDFNFDKPVKNVFDFTVQRLSGDRVMVSWHTEGEMQQARFEVMRKHEKGKPFASLGIVEPRSREDNSADYSFIDVNVFQDSTFYCLKKTDTDSVVFFSVTRGVGGVGKER